MLYALVGVVIVETAVLDLLVRVHHPTVANWVLVLDALTAIWVSRLARSVQTRPILVTDNDVHVRLGRMWSADVPRTNIASVETGRVKVPAKGTPGWLRVGPSPNVVLGLREPVEAVGPYRIRRKIDHFAMSLDDVKGFQAAIEAQDAG